MVDAGIAAVGRGATDIRQRVVEEGTYGKIVTPRVSSVTVNAPGAKSPGEALGWYQKHFGPSDQSREAEHRGRDIHGNEHDHGMER